MARSARRVWVALALSAAGAAAFAPAPAGGLRLRQASRDNQQPSAPRPRKLAVQVVDKSAASAQPARVCPLTCTPVLFLAVAASVSAPAVSFQGSLSPAPLSSAPCAPPPAPTLARCPPCCPPPPLPCMVHFCLCPAFLLSPSPSPRLVVVCPPLRFDCEFSCAARLVRCALQRDRLCLALAPVLRPALRAGATASGLRPFSATCRSRGRFMSGSAVPRRRCTHSRRGCIGYVRAIGARDGAADGPLQIFSSVHGWVLFEFQFPAHDLHLFLLIDVYARD